VRPLVIGHRGAAAHALENTQASFEQAVGFGVDMIELDVHESLDGEFIVIHDSHLGRISARREIVRKTPAAILKSVPLRGKHRLLTLSEAFEVIPPAVGIMVEIKVIRSFEKMAGFLKQQSNHRQVLATSFDLSLLLQLHNLRTGLSLGVVSKTPGNLAKAAAIGLEFRDVYLDFQCLTKLRTAQLQELYGRVFAWTVDRPRDIRRMLEYGIDGIISNQPDEVCRIMKSLDLS